MNTLTEADIKKAEDIFKIKLPKAYVNILKVQNGGEIIYNAFPILDNDFFSEAFIEVEYIYGIGKNPGILDSQYLLNEWEIPDGFILFNGDGHTWLAFDYRNVSSEPPIVYVNNDKETKVIKIANSFNEFSENLFTVEYEVVEDKEFHKPEYTKETFERLIEQDNVDELLDAISYLSQMESDIEWLGNGLLKLANHPDIKIRNQIANSVWNFLTYQLDDETLHSFIDIFKMDTDSGVQGYAEMIIEKINYSIDDLKRDIKRCIENGGYMVVSFIFQKNVYHIYQENKLKLEGPNNTQIFDSAEELIEHAILDGIPLQEMWCNVKTL
nr:SMI1/KNR4 family protein [Bacillus benzoevorans]